MADSRHKHAAPKARTRRTRPTRVILPAAGLLALGGVVAGVVVQDPGAGDRTAAVSKDRFAASASVMTGTVPAKVSRSAERPPLPNVADVEEQIEGLRYAVVALEIHAAAKKSSPVLAKVASGDTVDITGKNKGDWAQIMHKGLPRWVKADGLAKEMPLGTSPCASGSGPESGLLPDTIKVHRAVCAKFPSIVSYGGVAGRGEHATGHSLDIIVSSDLGNEIAAFLQENRAELGIEYLIWRQRIWRPATSASWRGMSSRGGATANHMDHVHVTTYGSCSHPLD
ncbi:SH3 domain-containing protein [Aeromicrobium sp. UC242_57]|uniref:SH3 domain-containing protein n=1 Tax=Aeromicrobium sp. UC242_57 TaxID=3374624 RepID=UPI0037B57914